MRAFHLGLVLSFSAFVLGCGSSSDDGAPATGGGSAQGGSSSGGGGSTGGGGSGGGKTYPPGPPGCGLDAAAFCDTFDAPAGDTTRAGELDGSRWSAARMCNIGGPTGDDEAVAIGPATVPTCRAGLPATVLPSSDALICDGNDSLQSNHLLMLVAAQNYGQNSYRIRQPLELADRTATIVFDAEGHNVGLLGWMSLEITEDPTPAPSFTFEQNFENGAIPENAIEIQFGSSCGGDNVGISDIIVYDGFQQTKVLSDTGTCVEAAAGKLNHFRVELSNTHVDVYATPASADGLSFGEPVLLGAADIDLPFSRGYVHATSHNHATLKYSDDTVDAWLTRWDNVGFDGPMVTGSWREYEALDPLDVTNAGKVNVGWRLADESTGPLGVISIPDVDPTGVVKARIALENWNLHHAGSAPNPDYALNYRLNGHAWKVRKLTAAELQMMIDLPNAGTRSLMLDVDIADLTPGTNTLELTTSNAEMSYPPVVLNVDLVLETN
jgi:hypothetical protein